MLDMLLQGMTLMAIGMGVVFLFLGLLVILTQQLSLWVAKYQPDTPELDTSTDQTDPLLISVISAAVHQYRLKHNQNQ